LLENLRSDSDKYTQTIVFVGSDRQSAYIDKLLAHNEDLLYTGHALQTIPHIANKLRAHYDPMLLANVFKGDSSRGVMDHDKVLTLYYQSHKAVLEHTNSVIELQVYSKDPYSGLESAIKVCPDIISKGTVLCLRKYAGEKLTQLLKTRGKGLPDKYYAKSIAAIIEGSPIRISEQGGAVREIRIGNGSNDVKPAALKALLHEALLPRVQNPQAYNVLRQALASPNHLRRGPIPGAH
jgi:hypothetical protein